jgi:hypothetical protein
MDHLIGAPIAEERASQRWAEEAVSREGQRLGVMDHLGVQGWKSQGSGGLSSHICSITPGAKAESANGPGGSMTTISGGVRWDRRVK